MIVSLWYFYWFPYLVKTYQYQLYFPKGLAEGIREIIPLLPQFFEKFYFSSLASYLAFAFFLIGIVVFIKSGHKYLKLGIGIISLIFLLFTIKTGAVFPLHSYYIIPFTPVMALIAAYGLSKIPAKYIYIPLLFIAIESLANQQHDLFIKPTENYKLSLENTADSLTAKTDLIAVNGNGNPQLSYFIHRKGWNLKNDSLKSNMYLNEIASKGCKFLFIDKHNYSDSIMLKCVVNNKNIAVYDLRAH